MKEHFPVMGPAALAQIPLHWGPSTSEQVCGHLRAGTCSRSLDMQPHPSITTLNMELLHKCLLID